MAVHYTRFERTAAVGSTRLYRVNVILRSAAGWVPVHRDQLWVERWVLNIEHWICLTLQPCSWVYGWTFQLAYTGPLHAANRKQSIYTLPGAARRAAFQRPDSVKCFWHFYSYSPGGSIWKSRTVNVKFTKLAAQADSNDDASDEIRSELSDAVLFHFTFVCPTLCVEYLDFTAPTVITDDSLNVCHLTLTWNYDSFSVCGNTTFLQLCSIDIRN